MGLGDLDAAARALLAVPEPARPALMARLLDEASAADAFRTREGRAHPRWGNGTLMAAALARPQAPRRPGCAAGLAALALAAHLAAARAGGLSSGANGIILTARDPHQPP